MLGRSSVVARSAMVTRRGSKGFDWLQRHYERKAAKAAQEKQWQKAPVFPVVEGMENMKRPKAFLEFQVGGEKVGRVTVELAGDLLPKTTENFMKLCKGEGQLPVVAEDGKVGHKSFGYQGSSMHKVMKDQFLTFGDVFNADGTGGFSALGNRFFDDEGFVVRHTKRGILSMANGGSNQNSSVFFITLKPLPHLDGKNVAFGHVVEGDHVLTKLEKVFAVKGKPINAVQISQCGVIDK